MGLPKAKVAKKITQEQQIRKQIALIMKDKQYQDTMKEWRKEDTLNALVKLCFLTMDYLQFKHRYKKRGLENFVTWYRDKVNSIKEDDVFLKDAEAYYRDEIGVDVFKILGVELSDKKGEE